MNATKITIKNVIPNKTIHSLIILLLLSYTSVISFAYTNILLSSNLSAKAE